MSACLRVYERVCMISLRNKEIISRCLVVYYTSIKRDIFHVRQYRKVMHGTWQMKTNIIDWFSGYLRSLFKSMCFSNLEYVLGTILNRG
jgi:hypothetical protein